MITPAQIQEAVQRIVNGYAPEQILLFGSYAYGTPTEDSDLDLLVVKETTDAPRLRDRTVKNMLQNLRIPVDVLVYTPLELDKWKTVKSSFEYQILTHGTLLYGKS
jgi:uncharacterized protein